VSTKKAIAKKTAVPAKKTVTKSAPVKAAAAVKAPMPKMRKTHVIRQMADQSEVPPKQIGAFFDPLIEIATTQTQKAGEFKIPGLGKLVKAQRAAAISGLMR
jgi:DNA-binding protein HU-beta